MDWTQMGDDIARWLGGNSGKEMYTSPIGPTQSGAPLASNLLPGVGGTPGGGMSLALAGPILQGLMAQPEPQRLPSPVNMTHPGQTMKFPALPSSNPASIRNRGGA